MNYTLASSRYIGQRILHNLTDRSIDLPAVRRTLVTFKLRTVAEWRNYLAWITHAWVDWTRGGHSHLLLGDGLHNSSVIRGPVPHALLHASFLPQFLPLDESLMVKWRLYYVSVYDETVRQIFKQGRDITCIDNFKQQLLTDLEAIAVSLTELQILIQVLDWYLSHTPAVPVYIWPSHPRKLVENYSMYITTMHVNYWIDPWLRLNIMPYYPHAR